MISHIYPSTLRSEKKLLRQRKDSNLTSGFAAEYLSAIVSEGGMIAGFFVGLLMIFIFIYY